MLRVALALLACRLLLAFALIPAWQQPDEPTHVARVVLHRSRIVSPGSPDPGREADILASMARHRWWEHRIAGLRPPDDIPTTFAQVPQRVGGPIETPAGFPVYIRAAGAVLSWIPALPVEQQMMALRVFSAMLGLLTLWLTWRAALECLSPLGSGAVALLVALHPHFVTFSTAASPDPVVVVFGALVWWQATVAVMRGRLIGPLAVMWAAAIAAAATDRVGVPLVAAAMAISVVAFAGRGVRIGWTTGRVLSVVAACALALGASAWALYVFGETYALTRIYRGGWFPVPDVMTWPRFADFNWFLFQSWWYSVGWGRYVPPAWWVAAAGAVTVTALLGVGRLILGNAGNGRLRTLALLAAIGIAIQLAAVYWTYFRLDIGGQGRYLFPFFAPSIILLWVGLESIAPRTPREFVAALAIVTLALLDAFVWIRLVIPVFYASV
jgi:hypothetical protein